MNGPTDAELDRLLADSDPISGNTMPPPTVALKTVLDGAEARRRRKRRWATAPLIPAVLIGVTAAALSLRPAPASDRDVISIECASDLDATRLVSIDAETADPVTDCATQWRQGRIVAGVTRAPTLTACSVGLRVTVYPMLDACRILAVPAFGGYSEDQRRTLTLNDQLSTYFEGAVGCVPVDTARAFVQQALRANRLDDWTVLTSAGSVCQGFIVNLAERTVTLT